MLGTTAINGASDCRNWTQKTGAEHLGQKHTKELFQRFRPSPPPLALPHTRGTYPSDLWENCRLLEVTAGRVSF